MIRRAAEAGAVHPAQFGGGVGLLCTCLCCLFAWRYASVPYLLHDSGWLYLQKRPSCCTYTIALSRSSVVWTTEAGGDSGATILVGYLPFLIMGHRQVLGFLPTYINEQGDN